jgi:hypothetical protein
MCETPYAYSWFWAMPRGVETSPTPAVQQLFCKIKEIPILKQQT